MIRRGFTLMETMVASALGMVVLAGTLTVGVQLQGRAFREQQTSLIQGGTQAMAEFLGPALQRAGEGMGNARISLGGTAFAYAIQVTTADTFAGFPSFAPPPDAYAARILGLPADSLGRPHLAGLARGLLALGRRRWNRAVLPRRERAVHADPGHQLRCGHGRVPGEPGPAGGVLSHHHRGGAARDPGGPRADPPSRPYPNSAEPASGDGCAMGGSVFATPGTSAMLAGGMTFRVNWASGSPVLEYTNRAPPLPSDSWTELSQDVEQMTVVLGVTNLQADAGVPLTWFPGADGWRADRRVRRGGAVRPAAAFPGGMGPPALDPTAWDALDAPRPCGGGAPGRAVQPPSRVRQRCPGWWRLRGRPRRQPGRRPRPAHAGRDARHPELLAGGELLRCCVAVSPCSRR